MSKYLFFLIPVISLFTSCNSSNKEHKLPHKTYYITCDSTDFKSIHHNFKENKYILAVLGSQNNNEAVKIRVRGDSSREYPKKSLKIKVLNGAHIEGKSIFNLNAEYKDKSFSHSYISSLIFKELNYPCFTSSMASVYVNNNLHGLFLEIENMDKNFLLRNKLNPKGDLYKATKDGACLFSLSELDVKWEKKSNKKNSWAPLRNLIIDIQDLTQLDFDTYIKDNFDYDKLIDYLAINNFIANGSTNYHNYYLYKDVENNGKWMFIPWDLDKSLSYYNWQPFAYHSTSSDWENDNPIIERCYLSKMIRADVIQKLSTFEEVLGPEFYQPILASIESALQKLVLEDITDKVDSKKQWKNAIRKERKFLDNRAQKAVAKMQEFPFSFEVHKTAPLLSSPFYLSWDKSSDSTEVSYELFLSKDFLYKDSVSTRVYKTNSSQIKITEDLALGEYYWKVVAVKKDLKATGFNSKNSFMLRKGTNLPSILDTSITLTEKESPYLINDSLIINENMLLSAEPGVVLLMNKNAEIKVFGGLNFKGSSSENIIIHPNIPNSYFHSIYFYSSSFDNDLEHVTIYDGLINSKYSSYSLRNVTITIKNRPMQFGTKRPSIIWAWYGSVSIDSLRLFGNGKGEGININWANSIVRNSRFYNTPDAIEFINVTGGEISNNLVLNSPDDAIDLNACKEVSIQNNTLVNSVDKGISIGAEQYGKSSNINIKHNYILGNKIGVSVKDSADVYTQNNTIAYNLIAFEVYKKNKQYNLGGSIFSVNDAFCENKTTEKVDEFSTLSSSSESNSCFVSRQDDGFVIPQELYYKVVNESLVLENHSLLTMNLNTAKLIVDEVYEVSLNKLSPIRAGEKAWIYKKKPKDRKHTNFSIDKRNFITEKSKLALKINDQVIQLKSSAK